MRAENPCYILGLTSGCDLAHDSWMARADLMDTPIRILLDPSMNWMRRYSVVSDENPRWVLSVLLFDTDGIIRMQEQHISPSQVCQLILDRIQSLEKQ